MSVQSDRQRDLDIAVIGMSGRFPGAPSVEALWANLRAGVESVTFFAETDPLRSGLGAAPRAGQRYVPASPVLEAPDLFDARFFGLPPREARMTDPQHRLFLECAYEALEQAGYPPGTGCSRVGVFASSFMSTYLLFSGLLPRFTDEFLPTLLGNDEDYLASRVSYLLDLTGPSIHVQTACSSSLVAVHLACQSLLNGECDLALAGGMTVRVPHRVGYLYEEGGIFSPDGHCRPFDARARGTIFGNGGGVVCLKRAAEALQDHDTVRAVIRGSAVNNDGASKSGYTAPSVGRQAEAVVEALSSAGVDAATVGYVEAHGTGTLLGDPIEVAALPRAFRTCTPACGYCALGSIKGNVGHFDAAAGVAGLIKAVLCLEHGELVPSINCTEPNPQIDFGATPFYVSTGLQAWASAGPRRACANSLGIGGTNAHVVLEEAPAAVAVGGGPQVLVLSARSAAGLSAAGTRLAAWLEGQADVPLAEVAHTLQVGRRAFPWRAAVVAEAAEGAAALLRAEGLGTQCSAAPGVAFVFPGQGAQHPGMGRTLYRDFAVFRRQLDLCAEVLHAERGEDLRQVMWAASAEVLQQTAWSQPALFAVELSLAQLWRSWGVEPAALLGHSLGEYVAACLAGVFSPEDGVRLVAARGELMQAQPPGAMLAVALSEEWLAAELDASGCTLAAVNGPAMCTVSGTVEQVGELAARLGRAGTLVRRLRTSHGFHSPLMEGAVAPFVERVASLHLCAPRLPFVSNVSGDWVRPEEATDPRYWGRHLREPVRFGPGVARLWEEPERLVLEVGPGQTLASLARQHPARGPHGRVVASLPHHGEARDERLAVLQALGSLWQAGAAVEWSAVNPARRRVGLPTYPFERQTYWASEPAAPGPAAPAPAPPNGKPAAAPTPPARPAARPAQQVAGVLGGLWAEILGVPQVQPGDAFFDLGGTSLTALRLFAGIEARFGCQLPLSTLFEAPTLGQLSERLGAQLAQQQAGGPGPCLVLIQPGERPPLYLVHPAGGNVLLYRDLARHLGSGQPVYGLQARDRTDDAPLPRTLEEMAAEYCSAVVAEHPDGPYLLGGYCLGGTIALEMARQLLAAGRQVALLAFFETYNWAHEARRSPRQQLQFYAEKARFHWLNLVQLGPGRRGDFLRAKWQATRSRARVWLGFALQRLRGRTPDAGAYRRLARVWANNDRLSMEYTPAPYPGPITEFRPTAEYTAYQVPQMRWDALAVGGLEVHRLSAYPAGMLVEPYVGELAARLAAAIQGVVGGAAPAAASGAEAREAARP